MKNSASRLFANSQAISITIFSLCLCLLLVPLSFTPRPATAQVEDKAAASSLTQAEARPVPLMVELPTPHILAAAYYRIGDDLHTTLTLNNKSPQPAEARVSLFSLDGQRLDLAPVIVANNSFSEIDLREQIGANEAFRQGSLQVLYHGQDLMMGSQVKIVDKAHSLVFDEQLVEPAAMFASSRLEGVWWLPSRQSEMRLALSNTTDAPLTVTLRANGLALPQREPFTLTLSPHETRLFDLPRDLNDYLGGALSKVGGLSLAHTGTPGALLARAFIAQPETGFSSSVQFIDPGKSKSSTLHGAGLRLGRAGDDKLTPVVVAHNTGDAEAIVTGRIPYTTADGEMATLRLPKFRLPAGETQQLNLTAALRSGQLPQDLASAGIEFEYTGAPGSVVMAAQSVGRDSNQVFRVPLLDPAAIPSATGGYPWRIAGDSATVVYLKNVTDEPQEYHLQLNYPGGAYSVGQRSVAAGQTVAFDVRALRDNQAPGAQGRTLPLEAAAGQVHWSVLGPATKTMIGRAEQADVAGGISSTYACAGCCPDSFFDGWVSPGEVHGFPGDVTQFTALRQNQTCYGELTAPFETYAHWTSLDPNVAFCGSGGLTEALNPGNTSIRANFGRVFFYGGPSCATTFADYFTNAVCNVLAPDVIFTTVTWRDERADFTLPGNSATLQISGDACRGAQFAINVTFRQPERSTGCCRNPVTNFVRVINSEYVVVASDFYENGTTTGEVSVTLKRTGEGTRNSVTINVGGSYQSGASWQGVGTVRLRCP